MKSQRHEKIEATFSQEIRSLIVSKFDQSNFGLVSVNEVVLNPKMTEAKIYVYAQKNKAKLVKALQASLRKFLPILFKRFDLRQIPKVIFVLDEGGKAADRIDELLAKIKKASLPKD